MTSVICIIPTYNERENVTLLVSELLSLYPELHILIVDDNSPDGTAEVVENHPAFHKNIFLLKRKLKDGLGPAYIDGFHWCLKKNYKMLVQMDADFSHRPKDLKILLADKFQNDVVVGSRWMSGGAIQNWSWFRILVSRMGNTYARLLLGKVIHDWTGGFNKWPAEALRRYDFSRFEAHGYAFQIEMKYMALRLNFHLQEVPIVFEERRAGHSKMSLGIILEAFWKVWGFRKKYSPS